MEELDGAEVEGSRLAQSERLLASAVREMLIFAHGIGNFER
jgi:hypothetical protein